jgi:hypothetical protein
MVMCLVKFYMFNAHGVMLWHIVIFKRFDITKGGTLCKWDMVMDMWLIKCLVLW